MSAGKKTILVSVTNDLVSDHRVHKTATVLQEEGWDVCLIGRLLPESAPVRRTYRTWRMRLPFRKHFGFYATYNIRLFLHLLFTRFDALWANDTDTLPANWLAARLKRKPLVFDAHELFPEVPELTQRPRIKWFWETIERWIFPKLKYSCTVCRSIADYYHQRYGIDMTVVRNIPATPPPAGITPAYHPQHRPLLLYQGAVNIGRGLEECIDLVATDPRPELLIVGTGDIAGEIQERITAKHLEDRIKMTGRIALDQLSAYTASADIGLVLLRPQGLNYYYSLPNRIFDFIQAGIPVIASDFPEIRRIVDTYGTGRLVPDLEPATLQRALDDLQQHPVPVENFERARSELNWEKESMGIRWLSDAIQRQ
ncbi:MAG: glycosyltransferase [Paludibacteraceae bacterium]|nr:glycosyltransferase [Paludibacteraceae bacterium]